METALNRLITEWQKTTPPGGTSWPIWIADRALSAEEHAATLESERDCQIRRVESLQQTLTTVNADNDELRRQLEQAQRDLKEYRDEIERMTNKAATS